MQTDDVPKSEDCLALNAWRPACAKGRLPVMVWIYGGALVHGQTLLYPAHNLAKQGVIVGGMNYRLGYLDQRAALQSTSLQSLGGETSLPTGGPRLTA